MSGRMSVGNVRGGCPDTSGSAGARNVTCSINQRKHFVAASSFSRVDDLRDLYRSDRSTPDCFLSSLAELSNSSRLTGSGNSNDVTRQRYVVACSVDVGFPHNDDCARRLVARPNVVEKYFYFRFEQNRKSERVDDEAGRYSAVYRRLCLVASAD